MKSPNYCDPPKWTDDCQGKKDYDGSLVYVSSRYWPGGGGFDALRFDGTWERNEDRPEIKPSATASIYLTRDDRLLAKEDFVGETEEEVKALVEQWVREQVNKVEAAVRIIYEAM